MYICFFDRSSPLCLSSFTSLCYSFSSYPFVRAMICNTIISMSRLVIPSGDDILGCHWGFVQCNITLHIANAAFNTLLNISYSKHISFVFTAYINEWKSSTVKQYYLHHIVKAKQLLPNLKHINNFNNTYNQILYPL